MPPRPAARKPAIFRQICELIPAHLVPKLARKYGIRSRGISPWSHIVAGLYAQFTHALGLNDVCDALSANRSLLGSIREAQPPSRNGLSHANRTRPAQMVQDLFWLVLDFLDRQSHGWGGGSFHRLPRRFHRQIKQTLHLGDFLGHNRMAIEWQIWTALLMYVLLRHLHRVVDWAHSFTRLFTCLRAVIWQRRWLLDYLTLYGTAGGSFRLQWTPHQAYLPGLEP